VKGTNSEEVYVVVNKVVSQFFGQGCKKSRGEKMKDSLAMLLKTHVGKMSVCGSLAMLLKQQRLYVVSRDVDENKEGYMT
jgi:hypothetical protein